MEAHGVYGFVIHPRVGLPRELGWMSERLLHFYAVAIEEARRRGMSVVLYDEGMYPSGSSSGQVVAANPAFQCRGLALAEAGVALPPARTADASRSSIGRSTASSAGCTISTAVPRRTSHLRPTSSTQTR